MAANPHVKQFTFSNGLPSNNVYQAYPDSKGFVWFATDAGAARFDGTHFKYFTIKEGLNTNEIVKIQEDSQGRIWFFNFNGTFNIFQGETILNSSNTPFLDLLKSDFMFKRMYEDKRKTLYFFDDVERYILELDTLNNVIKHRTKSKFFRKYGDERDYEGAFCLGLTRLNDHFNLFTSGGIFTSNNLGGIYEPVDTSIYIKRVFTNHSDINFADVFSNNLKKNIIIKYNGLEALDTIYFPFRKDSEVLTDVFEDKNRDYWISSYFSGVYCFKGGKLINHFPIIKSQNIEADHEGNIWIASYGEGAFLFNTNTLKHTHLGVSNFSGNGITSICVRKDGGIWAVDSERLFLVNKKEILGSSFFQPGAKIDQIQELGNNTLILGEQNLFLRAIKGISLENNYVKVGSIITDNQIVKRFTVNESNNKVSTLFPRLIYVFDQNDIFSTKGRFKASSERFFYSYFNSHDKLFINGNQIYQFENGQLEPFFPLEKFAGKIIRQHINLDNGLELFNIGGDSLYIFDGEEVNNFNNLLSFNPSQQIRHLHYQKPYLFLAGRSEVYYCRFPDNSIKGQKLEVYSLNLVFNNISQILFYDNELVIASDDGLTFVPEESFSQTLRKPPIPYFRNILLNDQPISVEKASLNFSGNKKIQFILGSIGFQANNAQFSYFLEGVDKSWATSSETSIIYSSLKPGNYSFRFRVRNPESEWSDELMFYVRILPTFWQHPFFFFLIILFLGILIYLFFLRKKNIALKIQNDKHQMLLLEQKSLHSMMNPHFIFNALGSIQSYLLKNEASDAGKYLSKFARLIRQNLNSTKASMIDLEEEIERLRNYLELEQMRMNKRFEFSINIDDSLDDDITIPSMILQPVVENAIWHGLAEVESNGIITIFFEKRDEKSLRIIVEDNGIGVEMASRKPSHKESHLKIGMELTRKRIEILGQKMNVKTGIKYSDAFPNSEKPGTRVEVIVPVGSDPIKS